MTMDRVVRFGNVEVRAAERAVLVDGRPAALGARAFDILLALIERRDRLVAKNELLDLVWPGLVVEENNLAVHVSALRKALGPQAIATIPGRGYRFTATLEASTPPSGDPFAAAPPPAPAPAPALPLARASSRPPLPLATTTLHGRDADLAALHESVLAHRLVTLAGAGGIGKTCLAIAAAHALLPRFPDGAAWIDLTRIDDASLVPRTVAESAGLPVAASDEAGGATGSVVEALTPLRMLLVLDNAEHLRGGLVAFVDALARRAPGVHVLVTSQVTLKADDEHVFRLAPLALPDADASLEQARANGAVALFVDQARAGDRHFALGPDNIREVVDLCRRLDGLPLAIRLAAARVSLLGLPGLAARLGDRLQVLGGGPRGAHPRQQTLLAALDWSHGLLDDDSRVVFRRLAVFAGGFTLEAVCEIASREGDEPWHLIDAFGELVDRSLVEPDARAERRYRLLETVRAYARLRLDQAGEREFAQDRHAAILGRLMDDAYESYWQLADRPWLDHVEPELENVRAALDWSAQRHPALALSLAGATSVAFLLTGQAPEARRRLAALEALVDDQVPAPIAARYWLERSRVHLGISGDRMRLYAERAAALARRQGDARGLYLALRCCVGSGTFAAAAADALLAEMAALEAPDWPARLKLQRHLAQIEALRSTGRLAQARGACEAVLEIADAARFDSVGAVARVALASTLLALDAPEEALRHALDHVDRPASRRGNLVLPALAVAAHALLRLGRAEEAGATVRRLVDASRIRDWEWFGQYADVFALHASTQGRLEDAARLLGFADATWMRGPLVVSCGTQHRQ
jgi:predicted ATPase/DNA-binding winged helix-turn-helix (wHTH) protein